MILFSWQTFAAFCAGALVAALAYRVLARRWISALKLRAKSIVEIAEKEAQILAREIKTKGGDSRFTNPERGKFAIRA